MKYVIYIVWVCRSAGHPKHGDVMAAAYRYGGTMQDMLSAQNYCGIQHPPKLKENAMPIVVRDNPGSKADAIKQYMEITGAKEFKNRWQKQD